MNRDNDASKTRKVLTLYCEHHDYQFRCVRTRDALIRLHEVRRDPHVETRMDSIETEFLLYKAGNWVSAIDIEESLCRLVSKYSFNRPLEPIR